VTEEFHYDLAYTSDEACEDIEPAVAIQLAQQHRDPASGLVCLAFIVIFAPFKVMSYVLVYFLNCTKYCTFRKHTYLIIPPTVGRRSWGYSDEHFCMSIRRRAGTIFQQGGQGQKSPVRHKRGIIFFTPISNFRGQMTPLTQTSRVPVHSCVCMCVRNNITRKILEQSVSIFCGHS